MPSLIHRRVNIAFGDHYVYYLCLLLILTQTIKLCSTCAAEFTSHAQSVYAGHMDG